MADNDAPTSGQTTSRLERANTEGGTEVRPEGNKHLLMRERTSEHSVRRCPENVTQLPPGGKVQEMEWMLPAAVPPLPPSV
jgi:hypothetical protein